ncbi:IS3 family transposase [Streptomyces sp. NPDC006967]|uniref:IS3 family transposase n=1 Tax=Streptomyces sp. NPDC006967 TaxID=3156906 RepID=UPI0033C9DA33
MIRFRFVDEHRNAHVVKRMCDVLGWDRSGYYTWHKNAEAREEKAGIEEELAHRIREIHTDSMGAYGALRITRELRRRGHVVNRKRVARIMRERQIAGTTRRKSRSLTRQGRSTAPAPDLVLRDFTAPMPGLKLVGDITCMPTAEGWLYLATVIDLCTREVVGWSMADHMRAQLVEDAIRMAPAGEHTAGNAIFHSDRGAQYASRQFRATLTELDIRQSVDRTGSCFDNEVFSAT